MFTNMRYVYEVYKEKGISKAAQNLYISQPALSAMIKKIEEKIGKPLFDRSTNPIKLTEFGEEYIKTAEKIMDLEEGYEQYIGDFNELKKGRLQVGGTYWFSVYVIAPMIQKFHSMYPNVSLGLYEESSVVLEQKLFNGELDLLIDNYRLDERIYEKKYFMTEELLLAVPATFESNNEVKECALKSQDIKKNKHKKKKMNSVSLKSFEKEPFVILRAHSDTRKRVEEMFKRANIQPNIQLKLNQILTTYHLTEQGMGISFVSDTVIKRMENNPQIIYYKIDDPYTEREVNLYYKKNKYLTKAMEEFIRIAKEEIDN